MICLGIETSCDETACALTDECSIISNVVSSSVSLHSQYGGIIPEIASRYHLEYIYDVVKDALSLSGKKLKNVDLVAVTRGPGLAGSLLTGISFAKTLSYALTKPLIGVNHIFAHLLSNFVRKKGLNTPDFPFIGLVISGGHTSLYECCSLNNFRLLGRTFDDAVGEAFDKVAKMLGLGYPGGPLIEKKALEFDKSFKINFPKPLIRKTSLDFSFSGIKTAVLYYLKDKKITQNLISGICYYFQESVFEVIVNKTVRACLSGNIKRIVIGGGVSANQRFRSMICELCRKHCIDVYIPELSYCVDNAAMIAVSGELYFKSGLQSDLFLSAEPNLEGGI